MLKKLARRVLKDDLDELYEILDALTKSEKRANDLANNLSKENASLRDGRPMREYSFAPESLTSEEQKIVEDFIETPIIKLISKWFKIKADQNCDMLVHAGQAKEEHRTLWRLAVLMYDDWRTFLEHCSKVKPKKKKK